MDVVSADDVVDNHCEFININVLNFGSDKVQLSDSGGVNNMDDVSPCNLQIMDDEV